MTNPTHQEIIAAHEALDTLCRETGVKTPVNALKWLILKALPPKPHPTMAEIEWNDDEHFLAEAEDESCSVLSRGECATSTGR